MTNIENKLNNYKFIIFLSAVPVFLLLFSSLLSIDTGIQNDCELYKYETNQVVENQKPNIFKNYNLEIRSNYKNLACIGKLMKFESGDSNIFYIGTSSIISIVITFLINSIFIFNCFRIKNLNKQGLNLVSFLIFNYFVNYFFNQNITNYTFLITPHRDALFDLSQLDPTQNNLFMYFLFMTVFISKLNNKYITSFSFIFFIFYQIEFLPFLFLFNYLINKYDIYDKNLFRKYSMVSTVFLFYFARIVSGFYFDPSTHHWWATTAQRIYLGLNRYDDLRKNLFASWCINRDIPDCYESIGVKVWAGGGTLERYLPLNGDVLLITRNIGTATLLFLLFIYFYIVFKLKFDWYIVSFLFLSPPLNFLTFLLNVDLILLIISIFCLTKYRVFPRLISIIIFVLSLYKIHVMGILLGIIFYSFKIKEKKIYIFNITLLTFSFLIFAFDKFINEYPTALATLWVQSYGFLNNALVFERIFNIDWKIFYVLLIFIFTVVTLSDRINLIYKNIKFENFMNSYLMYGLMFWFLPTILYVNHVYRLPLFYILFFQLFKNSENVVKWILFFALSFNPALYTLDFISNGLLIVNNIAIFLLLAIFARYVYENYFKSYLLNLKS